MTTQIRKGETFLGFPATRLKTLLNSWVKGNRHPRTLADIKSLKMTSGACAALLGEAMDRRFIGVSHDESLTVEDFRRGRCRSLQLTRAGHAIAAASAMPRASKSKAAKVLEELIENADRLSRDVHASTVVSQIWVFGSFMDDTKDDVGDLDVAILTRNTAVLERRGAEEINAHIERHYPGMVPDSTDRYRREEAWLDRMLYGRRRDPLIAPNEIRNLIALHCPCRLVYSDQRGGRIPAEDYEHHPASTERSKTVSEKLIMPELEKYEKEFHPTTAAIYMRASEIDGGMPAVLVTGRPHEHDLVRYGDRPLDGRSGFAIVVGEGSERAFFHVSRVHSTRKRRLWTYGLKIEAVHSESGFNPDTCRWNTLISTVKELLGADVLRFAHHRKGMGSYADIQFDIDYCDATRCMTTLTTAMERRLGNLLGSDDHTLLPPAYMFGIDITVDECPLEVFYPLEEFDDQDWAETGVSREAYLNWCRPNGGRTGAQA